MTGLQLESDHRDNEFYSFRYSTRLKKGDIVQIRLGADLEAARFQARKSFPDVLNQYWWLKPSDSSAFRELPLQVSDIFYYHGGVPVIVLVSAQGTLTRKAQIFVRKNDDPRNRLDAECKTLICTADLDQKAELLCHQNLLIRFEVAEQLKTNYPDFLPKEENQLFSYYILTGQLDNLIPFGKQAVEPLLERFFVTSNAKEAERIVDTLIHIGEPALSLLDDTTEYLSIMSSPYYAKRVNWTINQIKKKLDK